jgi:1-acyl-sn-glycerol-3-phosphate acyltransferase
MRPALRSPIFYGPDVTTARFPSLGSDVPTTGGTVSRAAGRLMLRLLGWRITGEIPNRRKFVIIVAPHSSNWDFPVGVAAKMSLGLRALWLGKDSLFRFPLGIVMRALGGMPVDRSTSNDVVNAVVARFAGQERLVLALAPEGTRKKVDRWRTGFYHIAHAAQVPIVPVALNWKERAIEIRAPFHTSGDLDGDLAVLQRLFADVPGRRPKR